MGFFSKRSHQQENNLHNTSHSYHFFSNINSIFFLFLHIALQHKKTHQFAQQLSHTQTELHLELYTSSLSRCLPSMFLSEYWHFSPWIPPEKQSHWGKWRIYPDRESKYHFGVPFTSWNWGLTEPIFGLQGFLDWVAINNRVNPKVQTVTSFHHTKFIRNIYTQRTIAQAISCKVTVVTTFKCRDRNFP